MRRLYQFLQTLSDVPRPARMALVIAFDVVVCIAAALAAFWLRLGEWNFVTQPVIAFTAISIAIWLLLALPLGIYRSLVRFSGRQTVAHLGVTCVVMSVALGVVLVSLRLEGVPRTLAVLHPLVFFFGLAGTRLGIASILLQATQAKLPARNRTRILIYGAGAAGQQIAVSVRQDPHLQVVGFVDESEVLAGRRLEGHYIWHSSELELAIALRQVDEVFLALSSLRSVRRKIIERVYRSGGGVRVRALPSVSELACGTVTVNDLKEVQIEELLGRDEVTPDDRLMSQNINAKCVLVTGAGGSIGSELCRQILMRQPSRIILVEQSEHALYVIDSEMREMQRRCGLAVEIVPVLADVANKTECGKVFEDWQPETVFHAAAYKHVPLLETNHLSAIRNNIMGTLNSCLGAELCGARSFILVSTDKAVRPTSVMGASKRVCELIVQARAAMTRGALTYSAVRFGNVLGSSGSVVPLFRNQIIAGGPVTITHVEATRYFMTIPEASQLVIQAGALADGGEVFLLDMGEPVRIHDLAKLMIELSGLSVADESNPDGDIEILEVGLRPGEKLIEELLIGRDASPTSHPRIVKARETFLNWSNLKPHLDDIAAAIQASDAAGALAKIALLVPEFRSSVVGSEGPQVITIAKTLSRAS